MESTVQPEQPPMALVDGVTTNLAPKEFAEVWKAVEEKRVAWDKDRTLLAVEWCDAEFTYKGARYHYTEKFEKPWALSRM